MSVLDLWLPILVSGVVTHILSTLAWTVLPHHKPEFKKVAGEDDFFAYLDKHDVQPGQYLFPYAHTVEEMQDEGFKAREAKCRGELLVWKHPVNMGKSIAQTFVFFLFAAFMIGYVASRGLASDSSFSDVFQLVGTVGLLTHCFGLFPGVFWFKKQVAMDLLDKAVYGLSTGLIFAALWP